jgi:hypothetical protein
MGNFDDARIVLIRNITLRLLELWGRPPTLEEIKAELGK